MNFTALSWSIARPIPSVCLSVWNIRSTAKTYSYYGEAVGSRTRATQATHLRPYTTTPSSQTGGWQPPVKTCIANCGQTVPDTRVVCNDSL